MISHTQHAIVFHTTQDFEWDFKTEPKSLRVWDLLSAKPATLFMVYEFITAVAVLITVIAAFVAVFPPEGASVAFFLEPRLGLRRAPLISFFFTSLRAS